MQYITIDVKKVKNMKIDLKSLIYIDWLIDWCLMSSEQFFSYIQDENI